MQDIPTIMEDMCSQMHNVGNNRIVADAHGNVEEVNHYYPYGALMGDSRNATTLQIHRQGARPHPWSRLVRPRCPPLRPRNGKVERNGCLGGEILRMATIRVVP